MSTMTEDFLEHYGVKGMKWGVRKANDATRSAGGKLSRSAKKAESKEWASNHKSWKKQVGGEKVANEIFQDAVKTFNPAVKKLNNTREFKGKDLKQDVMLRRSYDRQASKMFNDHMAEASVKRTFDPNLNRAMIYQFDSNRGMMRATESMLVEHADGSNWPEFPVEMDELGQIVSISMPNVDDFIAQMDEAVDFLEHYGVKGMKWGVRKVRADEGARKKAFGKKTPVKLEKPSRDATTTIKINSRVAAQKSTKQLTNKELKAAIERMRLEQQYSQMTGGLDKTKKQKAQAWVKGLIKEQLGGVQQIGQNYANDQVKLAVEKKTKTGRHDPLQTAQREANIAGAQARKRQAEAS